MSKGNTFENDLLQLIFNGVSITGIANNPTSSPQQFLYVSLHTADPGEAGTQATSEVSYTSYARVAVRRCNSDGTSNTTGWTVASGGNSVSPAAAISFPEATGGTATVTHFAIGTSEAVGSTGKVLYKGAISPSISIATGVTPRLTVSSTITED